MAKSIKGILFGALRRSDRQPVVPTDNGYRTAAQMGISQSMIVVPTKFDPNGKMMVLTDTGDYVQSTVADVAVSSAGGSLVGGMLARTNRSRMLTAPLGATPSVFSNIPTRTWQMLRETSLPYDGLRVILMHGDAAALAGIKVAAASGIDYNDKQGNALTWVDGTFGGNATGTLAAGTLQRPGLTVSDVIPVTSVARTDGRAGYLSYVRVYMPSNGTLPLSLHAQGNYQQWGVLTSEASYSTYGNGDFIASKTTMPAPPAPEGVGSSTIWGIEYLVQGNVVSTLLIGDSTFQAFGNTNVPWGMNFGEYAARSLNMVDGITAFTSANGGYQSQTSTQYFDRMTDLLAIVTPTAVAYEVFSPNDYANSATAVTDALISASLARVQKFLDLARTNNFVPILTTGIPAASGKNWNAASDAKRVALNTLLRERYGKFALVVDLDSVVTDGASPANIRTEYRHAGTDPLHPNTAGHIAEGVQFVSDALGPMQAVFS